MNKRLIAQGFLLPALFLFAGCASNHEEGRNDSNQIMDESIYSDETVTNEPTQRDNKELALLRAYFTRNVNFRVADVL